MTLGVSQLCDTCKAPEARAYGRGIKVRCQNVTIVYFPFHSDDMLPFSARFTHTSHMLPETLPFEVSIDHERLPSPKLDCEYLQRVFECVPLPRELAWLITSFVGCPNLVTELTARCI